MFRKYKVAYLLIFIFQNCGIIYAQNINLKETKKNTIKKEFKNVLIIGAGSTATRLVLDNLTDNLIKKLNKENINATYNYVGKLDRNTQIDFKNFINENYDGYLVFNLADTSYIDIKNKDFPLKYSNSNWRVNCTSRHKYCSIEIFRRFFDSIF